MITVIYVDTSPEQSVHYSFKQLAEAVENCRDSLRRLRRYAQSMVLLLLGVEISCFG